ncbi:hypothetical protein [Methylophilus sp. YYY-1]|uniref:hypothetical protein n=1 Tax=Methylophilus sp. YYY-1 TaxID=2682087 RepID=UPI0023B22D55|nr:hypothetical protein [Methylophilus sp. YYY-1]MDF0377711.1 hypothetical protein [Methylophilus sp. YYY-1]
MALKFEIIGNSLVVTETADGTVKLERPASDVFGVCELNQFKIFTRTQRNDILLSADYSSLVDSTGAALTKSTLTTFFRNKLGFNKAGSSALTTIQGTFDVGQTLTAVVADGVIATGFQWYRDNAAIAGATKSTYLLQDIDQGKVIRVTLTGLVVSSTNTDATPALTSARPTAMQASPLGSANGGKRSLSTAHNSSQMAMAAADTTDSVVEFSNVSFFDTATTAEYVSPDTLEVRGYVFTPGGAYGADTWSPRTFTGPLAVGATGANMSAPATESALYLIKFSSGELRWATLTFNSAAITWRKGLKQAATENYGFKAPNSNYWDRTQITENGNPVIVLPGGVKTYKRLVVPGAKQKKGIPAYVNWYVNKQGGGTFMLPAQQLPNGEDELFNGLQEALYDNATDYSNQYFGKDPWRTGTYGTGSFRGILSGLNPTNMSYRPVTVWGDSLISFLTSYMQVWLHKWGVPNKIISKAGQAPGDFATQSVIRKQMVDKGVLIIQLGINGPDVNAVKALIALGRSLGFTYIIYILPSNKTSSSNGYIDEDGQTQDLVTGPFNTAMRALEGQPDGPDRIWDGNAAVAGTDPTKLKANASTDGTHYTTLGRDLQVSYFDAQNYIADLALPA